MFSNISWATYFTAVAISSAVYYLYVGARYFTSDIKKRLSPSPRPRMRMDLPDEPDERESLSSHERIEQDFSNAPDGNEYDDIESLAERIKSALAIAENRKADPNEVKAFLHILFSEYPSLTNSPFRASINEMVASEYYKVSKVTLTEAEVDALWA